MNLLARSLIITLTLILLLSRSTQHTSALNMSQNGETEYQISIDRAIEIVKTGDTFQFTTTISYSGNSMSPKLIVAMNIVNLQDGTPVDPEDWSPQRKQFVSPLSQGSTAFKSWTVHAIIKGDYMVYMVVIPIPEGETDTSVPVSSSAIHLTVSPYTRLNPGGILPMAITMPALLIGLFVVLRWKRNKEIINF